MGRRAEVQRKLLEQLMGAESMGIVTVTPSLWDPKVCRAFVTGICTHDLFTNTKMDLGTCPRVHSPKLKNEYDALRAKAEAEEDQVKIKELNRLRLDFEQQVSSSTLAFVEECDRRIRMAQRRLEKTPEENARFVNLVGAELTDMCWSTHSEANGCIQQMREIGEVEGAYQAAMAEVELLGSEGKVEESLAQLTKAEALKSEKEEKERELQNLSETAGASGHQKLRVCDICGAYLSLLDSDRRLADHFGGRMHLGYHQLRIMMDEWRTRGPLATGPAPPHNGGALNGSAHPPPSGPPPSSASSGPASYRPPPSAPLSRPPPSGPMVPSGPPAPGFVPAAGPASATSSGRDRSDRDRSDRDRDSYRSDRDRERSSRDERDRERDGGERRSERDRSDRDRDGHRSSRDDRDRDHRGSRDERDSHRSSRRSEDDRDRGDRRSSRRYDDGDESRPSSSRRMDDAEDRLDGDKRRKIEA
ncbi:BZ3500_MvSof-1268-A1-R1_Chr4-3g07381 [Microbotryum saponariae]|uniref:BZ3500_MvSof-1268-A1-R1_Chr4-3g07381 protein n=1 Tax=Microbotryum saponariae TaxID=289078 RepID=A0A2X0LJ15_9BASI|nr:BZ3500_MvSof-1268-A1-R1_Chr4-3g07381 [Microbotryum saponariae]SDA07044.1 BZ3501_MvSof-1269-A2-R1_Chr4-2g07090 [Microbotryum saponariae]